jgi:hypothetical protein
MDKYVIETLVLISAAIYVIWKFFAHKNLRHLFSAVIFISLALCQWPLFLSYKIFFATISLLAAIFLFYEQVYQKHFKPSFQMTYMYIFLFAIFGLVFASESFLECSKKPLHKKTAHASTVYEKKA